MSTSLEALNKIPALFWLIVSGVFFAAGEYLSKKWALSPSFSGCAFVVGAYALGTLTWLPALYQKNELAVMGTIWLVIGMLATVLIGTVVFQESSSFRQVLGLAFGLVTVVLLAS